MRLTYRHKNTAVSIYDFEDDGYGARIYERVQNFRDDEVHLRCDQIGFPFEGDSVLDAVNWYHESLGLDAVDQHFVDLLFEVLWEQRENWRSIYLLVDRVEADSKGEWGIRCFGKGLVSKDYSKLYRINDGQGSSGRYILAITPTGLEQNKDFLLSPDGLAPRVWEIDLPKMTAEPF